MEASNSSDFDECLDVLVIGSGIAGLSAALSLSGKQVVVISKERDGGGSTRLAQGGIAAVMGPPDSEEAHARDTLIAAAGLADPRVVRSVTAEAAGVIEALAQLGVRFDAGPAAREGGHSAARVVHARGDATGAEISHVLMTACRDRGIPVLDGMVLLDLLTQPTASGSTRVVGALLWDCASKAVRCARASTVVLATGGYGHLWAGSTSPSACMGTGLAAALRAGAQVADLEFVQFHPTGMLLGIDPRPLASEALRGAGARLRDSIGKLLHSVTYPGAGDLAPRDIVSASMVQRMEELGSDHCFLDATLVDDELLDAHFGTFVSACRRSGIDPKREWVPVAPTAHYTMGGILTDENGRTTLEGLMAAGEVACSGLHGANRLASNSLLEGAVVGRRLAKVLMQTEGPVAPLEPVPLKEPLGGQFEASNGAPLENRPASVGPGPSDHSALEDRPASVGPGPSDHSALELEGVRKAMQSFAGPSRDADGLRRLARLLRDAPGSLSEPSEEDRLSDWQVARHESIGMRTLGRLVAQLALRRQESRGAHRRSDYPMTDKRWQVRQVVQLLPNGVLAVGELNAGREPDPSFDRETMAMTNHSQDAGQRQPTTFGQGNLVSR